MAGWQYSVGISSLDALQPTDWTGVERSSMGLERSSLFQHSGWFWYFKGYFGLLWWFMLFGVVWSGLRWFRLFEESSSSFLNLKAFTVGQFIIGRA